MGSGSVHLPCWPRSGRLTPPGPQGPLKLLPGTPSSLLPTELPLGPQRPAPTLPPPREPLPTPARSPLSSCGLLCSVAALVTAQSCCPLDLGVCVPRHLCRGPHTGVTTWGVGAAHLPRPHCSSLTSSDGDLEVVQVNTICALACWREDWPPGGRPAGTDGTVPGIHLFQIRVREAGSWLNGGGGGAHWGPCR